MKKSIPFLAFIFILAIACNTEQQKQNPTKGPKENRTSTGVDEFWKNLQPYCGKAFEGKITKAPENNEFQDQKLVMHFLSCEKDFMIIPFNVGDNRSRSWVLVKKENRLELKHDHRTKEGADDSITMYGGTSTNPGLAHMQVFPADEETANLIPAASGNVWWITLKDDTFTYNLKRMGSDREFSVAFDLSKEVETPKPSWGWENK